MDKRNNAYLYITCFIVSIGGLLLGISANVSGASMYFGDFFGLQSGSFQEGLAVSITMLATFIGNFFASTALLLLHIGQCTQSDVSVFSDKPLHRWTGYRNLTAGSPHVHCGTCTFR